MARLFLSYAHSDGAAAAEQLTAELSSHHDVWMDRERLHGGAIWSHSIEEEIDSSDIVLALLSHGSHSSIVCRGEHLRAGRKGKRFIPLRLTPDTDAVAATPDGQRAVSASRHKSLRVWDLASGHEMRTLQGHSDMVWAVAVTPDSKGVLSASHDQSLKVWDVASGRELCTFCGHSHRVTAVAVSPSGHRVISTSADNTVKVWDLEFGYELRTLQGYSDWVRAVAVSPDGRCVVSASRDRTLSIWASNRARPSRDSPPTLSL